jgi:hypothetical protein
MNLQCACCGGEAPSRKQWWNRDTGYGVCPRCFETAVKRDGEEEAIKTYGYPGIHHSINLGKWNEYRKNQKLAGKP